MQTTQETSKYYVFISDNFGISLLYPLLLKMLKEEAEHNNHFSVLYLSEEGIFIFQNEIETLSKRFPGILLAYFKKQPLKEYIETILNTNIKNHIQFDISLCEEWENQVVKHLLYLGVDQSSIRLLKENRINQFSNIIK